MVLAFPRCRFNFRGAGFERGEARVWPWRSRGRPRRDGLAGAGVFHLPVISPVFLSAPQWGRGLRALTRAQLRLSARECRCRSRMVNTAITFLRECTKPKTIHQRQRDEFGPRPALEQIVAAAAEPKQFVRVRDSGHFFEGKAG